MQNENQPEPKPIVTYRGMAFCLSIVCASKLSKSEAFSVHRISVECVVK